MFLPALWSLSCRVWVSPDSSCPGTVGQFIDSRSSTSGRAHALVARLTGPLRSSLGEAHCCQHDILWRLLLHKAVQLSHIDQSPVRLSRLNRPPNITRISVPDLIG